MDFAKEHQLHNLLLSRIKERLPQLRELKADAEREFGAPDRFYRFYYQSFKAYFIQEHTLNINDLFLAIGGEDYTLCPFYMEIMAEGTNKSFKFEYNEEWTKQTRPVLEAYFHAKMFLDLMIQSAESIPTTEAPHCLPSGWAAVLCLFRLR